MWHHYGLDLGTEWRARRFRKLLNAIDGLPRHSGFVEALTSDDEWAEQVLAAGEPEGLPSRRMSDWSPEMEQLTNILDAIRDLTAVTVAARGAKPNRVNPSPRPKTALDRVRKRRRTEQHRSLVARLLPHKAADG